MVLQKLRSDCIEEPRDKKSPKGYLRLVRRLTNGCISLEWDTKATVSWWAALVLPVVWPSGNELGSNTRSGSGWKYRKFRARFEGCLRKYSQVIPDATGLRRIYLVRWYGKGKRPFDLENLLWGAKPLIDAMVSLKYLVDDRPGLVQRKYEQPKSPTGKDYITVAIEETT